MIGQVNKEHQLTNNMDEADVMILNTCAFIESATEETIENIIELRDWKKSKQGRKIIIAGCFVEEKKETITTDYPFIDGTINTGALLQINSLLESISTSDGQNQIYSNRENNLLGQEERIQATPPHYAYLKIGDGCNHGCSFCKIPKLRGGSYFKKSEDILNEAKILANRGVKEIILIAQDITSYNDGENYRLPALLKDLEQIKKIEWIRLLYLYPDNITEELIKTIKASKKIVRYIDMPIQHISDKILTKMNRKSSKSTIVKIISLVKKELSDAKLRTTVITGFPGETETEFAELYTFLDQIKFDHLGVFAYSDQENIASSKLEGKLEEDVKDRRVDKIMKRQQLISTKLNKKYVGQTMEIMIDNLNGGRRYFDAPEIDGFVFINDVNDTDIGQIKKVKIKKALQYDLIGEFT